MYCKFISVSLQLRDWTSVVAFTAWWSLINSWTQRQERIDPLTLLSTRDKSSDKWYVAIDKTSQQHNVQTIKGLLTLRDLLLVSSTKPFLSATPLIFCVNSTVKLHRIYFYMGQKALTLTKFKRFFHDFCDIHNSTDWRHLCVYDVGGSAITDSVH